MSAVRIKWSYEFHSEAVCLLVGPDREMIFVHAEPVCAVSDYMKNIFSLPQPLVPDDPVFHPKPFKCFIEYCYFKDYFEANDGQESPLSLHASVYLLAEKLECSQLKDKALLKATHWCCDSRMQNLRGKIKSIALDVFGAISIIYKYTKDVYSESSISMAENGSQNGNTIKRNGFRILLAHLAATYLEDIQHLSTFTEARCNFPEFATDIIIFTNSGPRVLVKTDGSYTVKYSGALPPQPIQTQTDSGLEIPLRENPSRLGGNSISEFERLLSSDTFRIVVEGEAKEAKCFNVHTSALNCSGYFRRLISSTMKETLENLVVLDSDVDDPNTFEMFIQYCCFRNYACDDIYPDIIVSHAKVYTLAERLDCLPLKDLSLRKVTSFLDSRNINSDEKFSVALSTAVKVIYENTYEAPGNTTQSASVNQETKFASTDKFRLLLAHVAAAHLLRLRQHLTFIQTHCSYPEFANHLIQLVQKGEDMEMDGEFKLKIRKP
ncbi:hypothetical protein H072_3951 [Dactylellina haptotyla CBS 200.50]|uniref:BTB domain-containing protein n=1 Tax=Dactylellina haptotyla (strain CBS 200.50) TaxID=1284197 RepID=S8AGF3_DACHA|nr:hypothetical protein H072_3951 [Dactylellina haptotyla CBS 200.50]